MSDTTPEQTSPLELLADRLGELDHAYQTIGAGKLLLKTSDGPARAMQATSEVFAQINLVTDAMAVHFPNGLRDCIIIACAAFNLLGRLPDASGAEFDRLHGNCQRLLTNLINELGEQAGADAVDLRVDHLWNDHFDANWKMMRLLDELRDAEIALVKQSVPGDGEIEVNVKPSDAAGAGNARQH